MYTTVSGAVMHAPAFKTSKNGNSYVEFTIFDKTDSRQKHFVDCRVFGKSADYVSQYVKAGQIVVAHGNIEANTYLGKDGTAKVKFSMVPDKVNALWANENAANGDSLNKTVEDEMDAVEIPF